MFEPQLTTAALQTKLRQLAAGEPPRILDLFSGCGGLTMGFHAAGFQSVGAVECDADAAASHGANFHPGQAVHEVARDITQTPPELLAREFGFENDLTAVDVIVGGPPCQAFARVGRAKLRSVGTHDEFQDPRAHLYTEYLHYVRYFQPLAILMENVPEILNYGGRNVGELIAHDLAEQGYEVRYTLLNAVHYGVPQLRKRWFLLAYHRSTGLEVSFPPPTHQFDLPDGYRDSRFRVGRLRQNGLFRNSGHYVDPPEAPVAAFLPAAVTVGEAIRDLPKFHGSEARQKDRAQLPSPHEATPYTASMRQWFPDEPDRQQALHQTRYLKRDWQIFGRMSPGAQYPEAVRIAEALFQEALDALGDQAPCPGGVEYDALRKGIVPPYPVDSFPNKWRKLRADQPSHTLQAHLSRDSYSHIHPDPTQARTITVREAARLQSFPDDFILRGAMGSAFRQIGNAVPPLMARALAVSMNMALRNAANRTLDSRVRGSLDHGLPPGMQHEPY